MEIFNENQDRAPFGQAGQHATDRPKRDLAGILRAPPTKQSAQLPGDDSSVFVMKYLGD